MPAQNKATLSEIVDYLGKTYCGKLSVELHHISVSKATLSNQLTVFKRVFFSGKYLHIYTCMYILYYVILLYHNGH